MEYVALLSVPLFLVAMLLSGLLVASLYLPGSGQSGERRKVAGSLRILGLVTLVATWAGTLALLGARSNWLLVPWDVWAELRPGVGTLERALNDWFDQGANVFLPAVVFVGLDVALFLRRLAGRSDRAARSWLPIGFSLANAVFLAAYFLSIFVLADVADLWLATPDDARAAGYQHPDVGYHRTWPSIAFSLAAIGWLYWRHLRTGSPRPSVQSDPRIR